jgi:GNAT superfamily N-acetyltransferase
MGYTLKVKIVTMPTDRIWSLNLQIIRTRHPPLLYLEQVALLHTETGASVTGSEIRLLLEELPSKDRLLLAVDGETLLGYAHLRAARDLINKEMAEIVTVVVRQSHRRRNIGRRLVNAAETWARESGFKRLRFRVSDKNQEAHLFLNALGYEHTSSNDEFVSDLK